MRKKFAYTETLSSTGGKNIAIPGLGEISEAKMMVAIMIIILGFIIHTSLQVHITALLIGLVILAIPETSVGFDKTLAGIIDYYFTKKTEKQKTEKKKNMGTAKKSTAAKNKELIAIERFLGNYGRSIVGALSIILAIWLADTNIAVYFVEIIILLTVGLIMLITDYLIKVVKQ
ncbi:hypothetical protein J5U23_02908 [Saccharolobus shibatae B12]|uniref:Uncharacterized protein n=1 Tax=Saccharolobus shibatae (strain ATCC 51178 / DSM 5389 / JCM 8931 / NBRC 15437 / B12) TaxID=523848 RepID=A0A8F5BKR7_SACSH|nr:hypothetical protein [Saccharolobus shibatae]QXJ27126.1 hypothetical protein J5U23_p2908 [Saccharolobus shibatae B12]QXJ30019.1 hypothetical protein J5U23_02908 [Saccharolobus shibatae B12]